MRHYLVDTNVFLENLNVIDDYNIVVTSHVLRELEKHKSQTRDKALQASARHAVKKILEKRRNGETIHIDLKDYNWNVNDSFDKDYVDNKILQACVENDYGLITYDGLLLLKAEMYNIPIIELISTTVDDSYKGIRDIYVDEGSLDEEQILFFKELGEGAKVHTNVFDLSINEYLVLWDLNKPDKYDENGNVLAYKPYSKPYKWNGERHIKLRYKNIRGNGQLTEDVSPINVKQECMFDMLQNKKSTVKLTTGGFGVGKDYVMISHAVKRVQDPSDPIKKIIWVRNNVELEDSEPIGFLPGDKDEKLMEYAMPLADHLGGVDGLRFAMTQGDVELQHLGSLRGRDIKDSIIYVTEVQNNTREHVKLLLGRVGFGSELWLNGDIKQTDKQVFKRNSGLNALKSLSDNQLFSMITLDKIERSETARLAEEI